MTGRSLTALAAAAVLAISFAWSPEGLPKVSLCLFYDMTGLPCPGCGLTRGFCAISHGCLAEAWALNAFSFPLYLIAAGLLLWPAVAWLAPGIEQRLYHRRVLFLVPLVAGSMWLYGVARLLPLLES